jgi:hypothetical protein
MDGFPRYRGNLSFIIGYEQWTILRKSHDVMKNNNQTDSQEIMNVLVHDLVPNTPAFGLDGYQVPHGRGTFHLAKYKVDCCFGAFVLLQNGQNHYDVFRVVRRHNGLKNGATTKNYLCQMFPRLFGINATNFGSFDLSVFSPLEEPPSSCLSEIYSCKKYHLIPAKALEEHATLVLVFTVAELTSLGYDWCRGSKIAFVLRYHIDYDTDSRN